MSTDNKPRTKKSETLEVRIPHDTKQAFLTACREDGTTASEVVRTSVQTYLDERARPPQPEKRTLAMNLAQMNLPQPIRRYGLRAAAGGVAAIGLAAFAVLPSAAAPDFKAQFKVLDKNGDGVISADEFLNPGDDDKNDNDVVIETRHVTHNSKDGASPVTTKAPEIKQDAFAFYIPDGLAPAGKQDAHEYKFVSHNEVRTVTSDDKDSKDGAAQPTVSMTISVDDIRKKEFDSYDADHDGKVSLGEFQARQRAMFTRGFDILDANHDKSLSQDEYAKILAPPMIRITTDSPDVPTPPEVTIAGPKISTDALKSAFTKQDFNKDGKLSLEEYLPRD